MGEFLQFDLEASHKLWLLARDGSLEDMEYFVAKTPRVCFNLQQQVDKSYVMVALDWAVERNKEEMALWLVKKGAWTFRFTLVDFRERFPNITLKLNGRKIYHFWNYARENKTQDLVESLEAGGEAVVGGLIRIGVGDKGTGLDFAVEHKNEIAAKLLLGVGDKLCLKTPEEFRKVFPNITSPVSLEEKIKDTARATLEMLTEAKKKLPEEQSQRLKELFIDSITKI